MVVHMVDFARLKRLQLPEETGGMSTMTKVCLVILIISAILLVKRYKDVRNRPSEPF